MEVSTRVLSEEEAADPDASLLEVSLPEDSMASSETEVPISMPKSWSKTCWPLLGLYSAAAGFSLKPVNSLALRVTKTGASARRAHVLRAAEGVVAMVAPFVSVHAHMIEDCEG